jgi:hypothetical protein
MDIQEPNKSLGYSLWTEYLSQQAIQEIMNYSDSEECTKIPNTEKFSEHFHFGGSSSSSNKEEICPQPKPSRGCKITLREKRKQLSLHQKFLALSKLDIKLDQSKHENNKTYSK